MNRCWTLAVALVSSSAAGQSLFDRPGVHAYVPDTGQALLIAQAVDSGVHGMLPTTHRIARRRSLETNHIPSALRVIVMPDSVGTQQDSGKAMTLPRNGTTVRWDDGHGDVCRARETVVADTLTQFRDAVSGGSADQALEFHTDSAQTGP
jgi:hypothetical protein